MINFLKETGITWHNPILKTQPNAYSGYRYPAKFISHTDWLYHVFTGDIELTGEIDRQGVRQVYRLTALTLLISVILWIMVSATVAPLAED